MRLSFGGWNFLFPCRVQSKATGLYILVPTGKVKIVEKRREKRIPTVVKCVVNGERGTILDVSYHGTRVLMSGPHEMEEKVILEVDGEKLEGVVRWLKKEEVDLKSVGILISDPPDWWNRFVKDHISKYLSALRRL